MSLFEVNGSDQVDSSDLDSGFHDDGNLSAEVDPYRCVECLAVGDSCSFHAGFAAGWDACVSVVASAVDEAA